MIIHINGLKSIRTVSLAIKIQFWKFLHVNNKHRQVRFYTLRRMALAFALIKQMLKLENRSKEACDFGRDLWIEVGAGLFPDHSQSRPADTLLQNWNLGRPVALDISVVSPHNPSTLAEVGATFGAVLEATESRKHQANDEKCSALGWVSTPLAVDSYGAWGKEASLFLAQVAARLAIHKPLHVNIKDYSSLHAFCTVLEFNDIGVFVPCHKLPDNYMHIRNANCVTRPSNNTSFFMEACTHMNFVIQSLKCSQCLHQ